MSANINAASTGLEWLTAEPARLLYNLCDPSNPKLAQYLDLLVLVLEADAAWFVASTESGMQALLSSNSDIELSKEAEHFSQLAFSNNATLAIDDIALDARFADVSKLAPTRFSSFTGRKVGLEDKPALGCIVVASHTPVRYSTADYQALDKVAAMVDSDIRALVDINRDPLTRLSNRASFVNGCKHVLELCYRIDHGASMILFELPEFELLEKQYGDEFSKLIIRSLGGLVYSTLRCSDVVGRLDDGCIAALLPHNNNFDVTSIFKRFTASLQGFNESLVIDGNKPVGYELAPVISYLPYEPKRYRSVENMLAARSSYIRIESRSFTS